MKKKMMMVMMMTTQMTTLYWFPKLIQRKLGEGLIANLRYIVNHTNELCTFIN